MIQKLVFSGSFEREKFTLWYVRVFRWKSIVFDWHRWKNSTINICSVWFDFTFSLSIHECCNADSLWSIQYRSHIALLSVHTNNRKFRFSWAKLIAFWAIKKNMSIMHEFENVQTERCAHIDRNDKTVQIWNSIKRKSNNANHSSE